MKIRIPATNVSDLLRQRAGQVGGKLALVEGNRRLTWQQLDLQVDALARGLSTSGLLAGQRVAVSLLNGIELVVSYLATVRAGMVAVPLNPTSSAGEVARILSDSGARLCVCEADTADTVRAAVEGIRSAGEGLSATGAAGSLPRVVVAGAPPAAGEMAYAELAVPGAPVLSPLDAEALAVLLYSSGTSGRPRGVMLSHRALLANIDQSSQIRPAPVRRDDIVLGVLPLFHVYGLNAVLGQVLLVGATLVLSKHCHPQETLQLVSAEEVTCLPVSPPVIAALVDRPDTVEGLATVRMLLCGAAPLPEALWRRFEERVGQQVEQSYGLTEAAPVVTTTVGAPVHKPGSAGRALPGVEVRVVDSAGDDVGVGDAGEIVVRGANLFSGYWPNGAEAPAHTGWLRTGDIGYLDGDGDLYVLDRAKQIVTVSGFNVYPSEVEAVVYEVPGVRECAVIGVPDERTGEAVLAYVVAADRHDAATLEAAVRSHCELRLARFKVPAAVEVVGELPHSATGKVAKDRLRAEHQRRETRLA